MIYLLSQMSLIILLAAIAGGAFGWAIHRLRNQRNTEELRRVITQQQQQVKQAHTEVSMLAQDYDELKQTSSSTIDTLRNENRQIPNLHQNLEKSQLLVRQLMQKHEAQIREYASENETLKEKVKHLDDREQALNKLQSDIDRNRRELKDARKDSDEQTSQVSAKSEKASDTAAVTKDNQSNTASPSNTDSAANLSKDAVATTSSAAKSPAGSAKTESQTNSWASAESPGAVSSLSNKQSRVNNTSQSIAELTAKAQAKAKIEQQQKQAAALNTDSFTRSTDDVLDMSADVSGEAGSLTVALAEADIVLAAIDKKREEQQQTIADDEVVDTSELDFDVEFASDADQDDKIAPELLFDPVDQHDDLQTIFGIGPVTELGLNRLGITSYSQLAELKRHDIEKIASALEIVPGKIERENWVGNARRQLEDVLEEL